MCEIYEFSEKQKLIKIRRKLVRQNYSDLITNQNKTPTAAFIESYKYYNLLKYLSRIFQEDYRTF